MRIFCPAMALESSFVSYRCSCRAAARPDPRRARRPLQLALEAPPEAFAPTPEVGRVAPPPKLRRQLSPCGAPAGAVLLAPPGTHPSGSDDRGSGRTSVTTPGATAGGTCRPTVARQGNLPSMPNGVGPGPIAPCA